MAFRNIQVMLTANASSLRSQLALAGREVESFARKVEKHNTGIASSSKLMAAGFAAAGMAVAAGLAYSVSQATQFEQRMRNVNSISKLSEAQFKRLGQSVIGLSKELPQSANTLAEGLYDIASSGFQGAEGLKVLEASAKAASAGMSDTATAAKAITSVLNAYGREASDADDVSDALFQTVNLGVVSFGELAGVIGDVVGLAATAGVDIAQVGSAIATMTLSGISGSEAGTSLNRVLQSLIDPSDALKTTYQQLGYESGIVALKSKGLRGVMADLLKITGGNVNTLMAMFPEIRSLRGALALTANGMQNYNKVAGEIEDKNKRAGATAAALKEQMKALSAQWKIFMNNINAAAISLGNRLLPYIQQALKGLMDLGRSAMPAVISAVRALQPFFARLADIGADLVTITKDLITTLGPLAGAIAKVAGAAVIGTLTAFATVLATITGFLADHPALVMAVVAVYGVQLATAVAKAAASFASLALDKIAIGLYDAAGGATKLATSFNGVTAGITVAAIALLDYYTTIQRNSAAAKAMREELEKLAQVNSRRGQESAYQKASDKLMESQGKLADAQERVQKTLNPIAWRAAAKDVNKYHKQVQAAEKAQDGIMRSNQRFETNLNTLKQQTGATEEEITKFATSAGIDLTRGLKASEGSRQKIIDHFAAIKAAVGLSTSEIQTNMGLDIAAIEQLQKTVSDLMKEVGEAFAKSSDLISGFDPQKYAKGLEAVAAAQEKHRDALNDLAELKQDGQDDIDQANQLAKANKRVSDAAKGITDAQKGVVGAGSQIRTFYQDQIRQGETFITSVNDAIRRGLDPQLVIRLLKAGPEAATPILQGILSDHSGKLIQTVNESEAKLRELNTMAVEMARLTQLAVSSKTDAMTRDLPAAMNLATAIFRSGGQKSIEALAEELQVGVEEIKRVAASYGITIPIDVKWNLNKDMLQMDIERAARSATPTVNIPIASAPASAPPARVRANGGIDFFARGGVKEKHQAQIARAGDWRVWAEPETGGEAYIPLSPSKRGRSSQILSETARRMGFGLHRMDDGGLIDLIVGNQKFKEALSGTAQNIMWASNSGGRGTVGGNLLFDAYVGGQDPTPNLQRVGAAYAELALKVNEAVAQQLLMNDLSADGYVDAANQIIATAEEQRRAVEAAQEAQARAAEEGVRAQQEATAKQRAMQDVMFEFGALSQQQYVAILDARIAGEQQFTDEWAALMRQRQAALEQNTTSLADQMAKQAEIEQNQYQLGVITTDAYVAALQRRIAATEAYTDEWMELQAERANVADAERFYAQNLQTIQRANQLRAAAASSQSVTPSAGYQGIVLQQGAVAVEVKADAGVDSGALAAAVGGAVTTAVTTAMRQIDNELRRG